MRTTCYPPTPEPEPKPAATQTLVAVGVEEAEEATGKRDSAVDASQEHSRKDAPAYKWVSGYLGLLVLPFSGKSEAVLFHLV